MPVPRRPAATPRQQPPDATRPSSGAAETQGHRELFEKRRSAKVIRTARHPRLGDDRPFGDALSEANKRRTMLSSSHGPAFLPGLLS
jgi:hypothetical protein